TLAILPSPKFGRGVRGEGRPCRRRPTLGRRPVATKFISLHKGSCADAFGMAPHSIGRRNRVLRDLSRRSTAVPLQGLGNDARANDARALGNALAETTGSLRPARRSGGAAPRVCVAGSLLPQPRPHRILPLPLLRSGPLLRPPPQ